MDTANAALIGIDWGTTSFRAYLISAQGEVIDSIDAPKGIMQVPDKDFEGVLVKVLEPWLPKYSLPLIASGMITSRNGWIETPYLQLPASADQLANALIQQRTQQRTSNGLTVHLITGLTAQFNGVPDVMRGEETQIIGVVESGLTNGVFVMPGTHSKWVTVRDGHIEKFTTYMSGEIFTALKGHTILGTLMSGTEFNESGFVQGVAAGFDAGSQLLHTLFHVRTMPLFGLIDENAVSDYLSGMLIGAEISGATDNNASATNSKAHSKAVGLEELTIVGNDSLADRYAVALEFLELKVIKADENAVARGHFAIAKAAGLIQ